MNSLAPAVLASQVLDQNRKSVRRKKKSKAIPIGFPAPLRRRLTMRKTTEINDMDLDDDDPVVSLHSSESMSMMMGEDLDEAYGQSRLHRSGSSKSFQNISHISAKLIGIFI